VATLDLAADSLRFWRVPDADGAAPVEFLLPRA
jgi:hypothetical protein